MKKAKVTIIIASIFLVVLIGFVVVLGSVFLKTKEETYFPEGALEEVNSEPDTKFDRTELNDIYYIMEKMKVDFPIVSNRTEPVFAYDKSVWGNYHSYNPECDIFVMNVAGNDLKTNIGETYLDTIVPILLKAENVYQEKKVQEGFLYHFPAHYSTGIITSESTLVAKTKLYIVAYDITLKDGMSVMYCATTKDIEQLQKTQQLLLTFIQQSIAIDGITYSSNTTYGDTDTSKEEIVSENVVGNEEVDELSETDGEEQEVTGYTATEAQENMIYLGDAYTESADGSKVYEFDIDKNLDEVLFMYYFKGEGTENSFYLTDNYGKSITAYQIDNEQGIAYFKVTGVGRGSWALHVVESSIESNFLNYKVVLK